MVSLASTVVEFLLSERRLWMLDLHRPKSLGLAWPFDSTNSERVARGMGGSLNRGIRC